MSDVIPIEPLVAAVERLSAAGNGANAAACRDAYAEVAVGAASRRAG
jgi:hypothetical protein